MAFRKIQPNLDVYWFLDEQMTIIHRDNDLPAIEMADGSLFWYQNGLIHRSNDLPAIIFANGDQFWFINGKAHRNDDQPSAIFATGRKEWHKNGLLHRECQIFKDGSTGEQPPAIEDPKEQAKYWYKHGVLHRPDDLPALEINAIKRWYTNGVQHRNFGPAETAPFSEKWFWHGRQVDKEEHPWIIAQKEQELLFKQTPTSNLNKNNFPNSCTVHNTAHNSDATPTPTDNASSQQHLISKDCVDTDSQILNQTHTKTFRI